MCSNKGQYAFEREIISKSVVVCETCEKTQNCDFGEKNCSRENV